MKKGEATNTFEKGMYMDFNPLASPSGVLTNCLNGTLLTFNGNENVLQNDMGNARVENAVLPEGYIPLGTCSYEGIIYIVSYNPLTDQSQIGCFPSPERNFNAADNLQPFEFSFSQFYDDKFTVKGYNDRNDYSLEDYLNHLVVINNSIKINLIHADSIEELSPGDFYRIYYRGDYQNVTPYLNWELYYESDSGIITKVDDFKDICESAITEDIPSKVDEYRKTLNKDYSVYGDSAKGHLILQASLISPESYSVSFSSYRVRDNAVWAMFEGNLVMDEPKFIKGHLIVIEGSTTKTIQLVNSNTSCLQNIELYKASETEKITITCYPVMEYGVLDYLKQQVVLEPALLNKGIFKVSKWKYFVEDTKVQLDFGLALYPEFDNTPKNIQLEFYDLKQCRVSFSSAEPWEATIKSGEASYIYQLNSTSTGNYTIIDTFDNLVLDTCYCVRISILLEDGTYTYLYRIFYTSNQFNSKYSELEDFDSLYLNEVLNVEVYSDTNTNIKSSHDFVNGVNIGFYQNIGDNTPSNETLTIPTSTDIIKENYKVQNIATLDTTIDNNSSLFNVRFLSASYSNSGYSNYSEDFTDDTPEIVCGATLKNVLFTRIVDTSTQSDIEVSYNDSITEVIPQNCYKPLSIYGFNKYADYQDDSENTTAKIYDYLYLGMYVKKSGEGHTMILLDMDNRVTPYYSQSQKSKYEEEDIDEKSEYNTLGSVLVSDQLHEEDKNKGHIVAYIDTFDNIYSYIDSSFANYDIIPIRLLGGYYAYGDQGAANPYFTTNIVKQDGKWNIIKNSPYMDCFLVRNYSGKLQILPTRTCKSTGGQNLPGTSKSNILDVVSDAAFEGESREDWAEITDVQDEDVTTTTTDDNSGPANPGSTSLPTSGLNNNNLIDRNTTASKTATKESKSQSIFNTQGLADYYKLVDNTNSEGANIHKYDTIQINGKVTELSNQDIQVDWKTTINYTYDINLSLYIEDELPPNLMFTDVKGSEDVTFQYYLTHDYESISEILDTENITAVSMPIIDADKSEVTEYKFLLNSYYSDYAQLLRRKVDENNNQVFVLNPTIKHLITGSEYSTKCVDGILQINCSRDSRYYIKLYADDEGVTIKLV